MLIYERAQVLKSSFGTNHATLTNAFAYESKLNYKRVCYILPFHPYITLALALSNTSQKS